MPRICQKHQCQMLGGNSLCPHEFCIECRKEELGKKKKKETSDSLEDW